MVFIFDQYLLGIGAARRTADCMDRITSDAAIHAGGLPVFDDSFMTDVEAASEL